MSNCAHCGKAGAEYIFQALEIRTLHLRELRGERWVQGLGELRWCAVCQNCARKRLDSLRTPWTRLFRRLLPFGIVLLFGVGVLGLLRPAERPFQMFGAAATICGAVGLVSTIRSAWRLQRAWSTKPPEVALEDAAWDYALEILPRKKDDADITYLPINQETRAMDHAELSRRFDLLPPIAKEAEERITSIPVSQ